MERVMSGSGGPDEGLGELRGGGGVSLAAPATGVLLSQHFLREILAARFASRLGESTRGRGYRAAVRWWRQAQLLLGPASGLRSLRDVGAPLFALLGYRVRAVGQDERLPSMHCLLEGRRGEVVDLLIASWTCPLDRLWRAAINAGIVSGRRWVLGFNGRSVRVFDVDRPYARRHLEFDLGVVLQDERLFPVFWGLVRAQAFAVPLRRPAVMLFDEVVGASEGHGAGVRAGLQGGVREALTRLSLALGRTACPARPGARRGVVASGEEVAADEIVSQALTLVYRLLFLLFAEARALVPIWHPVYRESYSLTVLQREIDQRGGLDRQGDGPRAGEAEGMRASRVPRGLWDVLRAISRLAHDGCRTDEFSMTAFNGRLFSPAVTPLGERGRVSSLVVAEVLRALTRTRAGPGRRCERITYGDLGVEELGAIYERLLDHVPAVEAETRAAMARGRVRGRAPRESACEPEHVPIQESVQESVQESARESVQKPAEESDGEKRAASRAPVAAVVGRISRKATGTFYTPRSMADYLVRETLAPLVTDVAPERVLSLRVLDPAMGSGAFLVCACRYLAWAYERALESSGRPPPRTPAERAEHRRAIARRCLFGVDVNPVAVQLARLSVWLTTLMADAPLTFLDHHLKVGDSLIGASFNDLARRGPAEPVAGGRKRGRRGRAEGVRAFPLFAQEDVAQALRGVVKGRAELEREDDTPAAVRRKERLHERLGRDAVLSAWRRLADVWCSSWFWESGYGPGPPGRAWPAISDFVRHGREELPRDQLARWLDGVAAIARKRRFFHWAFEFPEVFFDEGRDEREGVGFDAVVGNPPWHVLRVDGEASHAEVVADQRMRAAMLGGFVRESGVYEPLADAHPNLYQLFVDRASGLLKRGGRLGLIAPWGLACDQGSARLRRRLFERSAVDRIVSFENSGRVFPIHPNLRFLLFTSTSGRETSVVRCQLGERDPCVLDRAGGEERGVALSVRVLRRVSGEGLAVPDVRDACEVGLLDRLHARWPALGSRDGWGVAFGRELNATDDRRLMEEAPGEAGHEAAQKLAQGADAEGRDGRERLVIEGKHLRPFRVEAGQVRRRVRAEAWEQVRARVPGVRRARVAYREVTFPGRQLSLVAARLPAGCVSTHTVFCLKNRLGKRLQWVLCGLLNSLVCNYLVRVRAGSHVTAGLIQAVPVPRPLAGSWEARRLARLARRLSAGEHGRWYARVQAVAAWVYGVQESELAVIFRRFRVADGRMGRRILAAYRRVATRRG